VYTYLLENQGAVRSREQLQAFAAAAKALGLSRAETLQLLNLRPTTLVELHLVISNCEARLAPEQLEELLALVAQHLRS
jgi:DNA-directed RNA polymerase subunit F